jgi:hypothetical protein
MPASFAKDILPLFRPIDIEHMKAYDVSLDDYACMSDSSNNYQNAQGVLKTLTTKRMPPGGPFWTQDQLDLFGRWMTDGYRP